MTAIVALKRNGEVWMGADGLCVYGWDIAERNSQKINLFPNFAVANCGLGTYQIVIEELAKDKQFLRSKTARMESRLDAAKLGILFHKGLKDMAIDLPGDRTSDNDFSGEFIVATPTAIYRVDACGYAYEVQDFLCMGSGGPFMAGFLTQAMDVNSFLSRTMDSQLSTPFLVEESIKVAIARSAGCGGEITVIKISPENLPEPPPPPRKRKTKQEKVEESDPKADHPLLKELLKDEVGETKKLYSQEDLAFDMMEGS